MSDQYRAEAIKQTVLKADLEKRLENAVADCKGLESELSSARDTISELSRKLNSLKERYWLERGFAHSAAESGSETPWTDAVCAFLKSRKTFEQTDFEVWQDHGRKMEMSVRHWLAESISQSESKHRMKLRLQEADFWLAHLEDYTKGEAGDEITALRSEIEEALK